MLRRFSKLSSIKTVFYHAKLTEIANHGKFISRIIIKLVLTAKIVQHVRQKFVGAVHVIINRKNVFC